MCLKYLCSVVDFLSHHLNDYLESCFFKFCVWCLWWSWSLWAFLCCKKAPFLLLDPDHPHSTTLCVFFWDKPATSLWHKMQVLLIVHSRNCFSKVLWTRQHLICFFPLHTILQHYPRKLCTFSYSPPLSCYFLGNAVHTLHMIWTWRKFPQHPARRTCTCSVQNTLTCRGGGGSSHLTSTVYSSPSEPVTSGLIVKELYF